MDKILDIIRRKGPILPMELAHELKVDSFIASAHLSDLSSKKTVEISHLKVGSSPLYYLPDQKHMLERFTNYLHEKEKMAFEELKAKRVLRDIALSPVIRVALKNTKDFAIPLEVTYQNNKEIFWKFYSLTNEQASEEIKKFIMPEPVKREIPKKRELEIPEPEVKKVKKPVKEEEKHELKEFFREQPKKIERKEQTKEISDKFFSYISEYFEKMNVKIINFAIIKKDEIDLEIDIPTSLGAVKYYCKAKNKKKLAETDLHSAFVQGELRKLPTMIISPGDFPKNTKEKLEKEFKSIKIVKI